MLQGQNVNGNLALLCLKNDRKAGLGPTQNKGNTEYHGVLSS